ncbi:MAG: DUF4157 domain-containing protein [Pyrinomonadaceae bacterium]
MNARADKTQENKSQSAGNAVSQKHDGESAFQFSDNRPEATAQKKLKEIANNNSQVKQLRTVQEMTKNDSHPKEAAQLQRMTNDYSAQQYPIQKKENKTGLPDNLKSGIENLSGYSMDGVKVHYNSDKPARLQAHAYAQGTNIHVAAGQEKHLPHEAWHVVQQKQGKVNPILQMKGVEINDDAGLEREADAMGAKALQLDNATTGGSAGHQPVIQDNGGIIQRVITYKGKQYKSLKDVGSEKGNDVFTQYQASKDADKAKKLNDPKNVYDLENGLKLVELQIVKSKQELRNELGASRTTDVAFETRESDDHYPRDATLYAPINHAIIVINDGPYEYVGTGGLIGCVEVMIECHTETDKGYLVAHVSSDIDDNEPEIKRQLNVMLQALGEELNAPLRWRDFRKGSKTHKLTLVRSARLGEQILLTNMRNILAENGAYMNLLNSNSASMRITAEGAEYLDNQQRQDDTTPPNMDYRKEAGYPFPEGK